MKRIYTTIIALLCTGMLFSASLNFVGGKSSLSLKEGKEEVVLSEGAKIKLDSMEISSDKITIYGTDWQFIRCEGRTQVVDHDRGMEINANGIWFDRINEKLAISSWFEIEDTKEEISAIGLSMFFDMKGETLELSQNINLSKLTDSGLMRCRAESIIYNRSNQTLVLSSGATVDWNGDSYSAKLISVDLKDDSISLEGRIEGSING